MRLPSLNMPQRVVLAVIAVIITAIQIEHFDENGVTGYGWILSAIVVAALLLCAFNSRRAGTRFSSPACGDISALVSANILVTNKVTEAIGQDLFSDSKGVQTNHGPLADVMASLARSTLILYAHGIVSVCKFRTNPSYFSSEEYLKTKNSLILQCAVSDSRIHGQSATDADKLKLVSSFTEEMTAIEEAIQDFVERIRAGNTKAPSLKLSMWLRTKLGVSSVGSLSLEEFARKQLRFADQLVSGKNA